MQEEYGRINYAEIHKYIPIYFKEKENFSALCKEIRQSSLVLSKEVEEIIEHSFFEKSLKMVESLNKNLKTNNINDFKYKLHDKISIKPKKHNKYVMDFLESKGRLFEGDFEKMMIISTLNEEIDFRREMSNVEFRQAKRIYNDSYINFHERFLLMPAKIKFKNKGTTFLIPELLVFSNGMAIIKYEISLSDFSVEDFFEDILNLNIEKINLLNLTKKIEFNNIDELTNHLIYTLTHNLRTTIYRQGKNFDNFIILDYEKIPKSLESIDDSIKKMIYFILSAPVPNREESYHNKLARDFVENQCSTTHTGINYYLKTNGGCLTLVSKNALEKYKKIYNFDNVMDDEKIYIHRRLSIELNLNCEFAILISVLDRLNNELYVMNRFISDDYKKKIYYNTTKIMLLKLQEYCYGSVAIQSKEFKEKMYLYNNDDNYNHISTLIDSSLRENELQSEKSFQKYVSVLSVLFVAIGGFPSIHQTLTTFKSMLPEKDYIPFIDIVQLSCFIWVLMIAATIIGFIYFMKSKPK